MAEKTLRDFSVLSAANVATGPNVDVGDVNFELKSTLINTVQAPILWQDKRGRQCPSQEFPGALQDRNHMGCCS